MKLIQHSELCAAQPSHERDFCTSVGELRFIVPPVRLIPSQRSLDALYVCLKFKVLCEILNMDACWPVRQLFCVVCALFLFFFFFAHSLKTTAQDSRKDFAAFPLFSCSSNFICSSASHYFPEPQICGGFSRVMFIAVP